MVFFSRFLFREDYYDHDDDENGMKKVMLFETFKMCLNDDHKGLEPTACAKNGKPLALLKLITDSLTCVKEDAMPEINRSLVDPPAPLCVPSLSLSVPPSKLLPPLPEKEKEHSFIENYKP
jgi:hypothetical protein